MKNLRWLLLAGFFYTFPFAILGGIIYSQLGHGIPYLLGTVIIVLAIASIALAMPALKTPNVHPE